MPKLTADAFRIRTENGHSTISFRSEQGRVFDIVLSTAVLQSISQSLRDSLAEIEVMVSRRQSIGYRSLSDVDVHPTEEAPDPTQKGMLFGAAISGDYQMVIPWFNIPNKSGKGGQQVAVGFPVEDAEKLVRDLQRAIEIVRERQPPQPDLAN